MELLVPANGKIGSTRWNYLTLPLIDRSVTIKYRIRLDTVFLEHSLDCALLGRRNADGLVLHAVELRLPYQEDDIILYILGFCIR